MKHQLYLELGDISIIVLLSWYGVFIVCQFLFPYHDSLNVVFSLDFTAALQITDNFPTFSDCLAQ